MKRIGLFLLAFTLFVGMKAADKRINVDSLKNELRQEIVDNDAQLRQSQRDSILCSKLSANQLADFKRKEIEIQAAISYLSQMSVC